MIKNALKYTLMGLAAIAIAALPLQAQDKPQTHEGANHKKEAAKGDKAHRVIPFKGALAAKTDASITVGDRTFVVTSETKILNGDKPGTLADAEIGKPVTGAYHEQDGKLVAKSIHLGAKTDGNAGGTHHKEKAAKK